MEEVRFSDLSIRELQRDPMMKQPPFSQAVPHRNPRPEEGMKDRRGPRHSLAVIATLLILASVGPTRAQSPETEARIKARQALRRGAWRAAGVTGARAAREGTAP